MTRNWTFTLTDITKTYNLWNDLIAPTVLDLTFSNVPYIPKTVQELKVQNQTAGTISTWSSIQLSGGSWDVKRAAVNSIDLSKETLSTDTNPTVLYVAIIAN
jgi:hypothetical protein